MTLLDAPMSVLGAWGTRYQKILKSRNIHTCRDLVSYFPYRIDDFSAIVTIADIRPEMRITISGVIQLIANRRSLRTRKVITEALVSDATGSIKALWFNQPFLIKNLKVGDRVNLAGKASDQFLDLQLMSPAYEKTGISNDSLHTGRCVPVYSLPEKMSQKIFRSLIKQVLDKSISDRVEWIPKEILDRECMVGIQQALHEIHFPQSLVSWEKARDRYKFEELLMLQLTQQQLRKEFEQIPAYSIVRTKHLEDAFIQSLPFTITRAQQNAQEDIFHDLEGHFPMNRLLEGDVGSGKTVVAVSALLHVAQVGLQTVYMAPTEILARQHFQTMSSLLKKYAINIALITSSTYVSWNQVKGNRSHQTKKEKLLLLDEIRSGNSSIVIGTHALLEEKIVFNNLGLVVIDEQHRFGVRQRKMVREKNNSGIMPHLLSMTATPIPRSLALTLYGDLELSIIDELPEGRKKIVTKLVPARYREWTYDFIKKMVVMGRQVFIICPLIDPSDILGVRSVSQEYKRLKEQVFPELSIGMLHGKLKPAQKEAVMNGFIEQRISLLVATSVIEVGVDIPNATIMMIEGAERFGLAQLHQFRGRIGRSHHQSYCFLLPTVEDALENTRLKAVVSCSNGFELAEKDLELRGSGEIFGQRQSGLPDLKFASLSDHELIKKTRNYAKEIIQKLEQYPEIIKQMKEYQKGELRD